MNKRQQELQKQVSQYNNNNKETFLGRGGGDAPSLNFKSSSSSFTFVFVVFLVVVADSTHLHVVCCHFACLMLRLQGHTCCLSALYRNRATII